ncbi:MAG: MraY family glycosyltransferase [Bacteroidota bacterium]
MEILLMLSALFIGFILTIIAVPPILRVARAKKMFDINGGRKIHKQVVPPLGGVAIFIGFVLSTIFFTDGLSFDSLKYIIAAIILLFFIGLKDDLLTISARKKFIVQFLSAIILVSFTNLRFTNLHGMFGIHEVNYFVGFIISLFATLVFINAYNLIDGIDGLASGLGILAGTVLGVMFYLSDNAQFAIMSFALVGSLSGFFLYNVFGKTNKLFMGDTGSLIVGLVISALVIKFNEIHYLSSAHIKFQSPVFTFAVVIVPLIDTLRVITIRILQGKSPFFADNNHIHHRLLYLFPSHIKVTLIIIEVNILIIGLALHLNALSLNINIQFAIILLVGVLTSFIPSYLLNTNISNQSRVPV